MKRLYHLLVGVLLITSVSYSLNYLLFPKDTLICGCGEPPRDGPSVGQQWIQVIYAANNGKCCTPGDINAGQQVIWTWNGEIWTAAPAMVLTEAEVLELCCN